MCFDIHEVRGQFPALETTVHGRPLVYLDNAATAQVPKVVLDKIYDCESRRGNVHRGIHSLGKDSSEVYENARQEVARFIGATPEQIVFTSGTTDGINRVSKAAGECIGEKDAVLVSLMEHHSNFVPWQQLCLKTGAEFKIVPLTPNGEFDICKFSKMLDKKVKIVAITHCSNVLGTVNNVEKICSIAHENGAKVMVDAAQSICHRRIDVQKIDCDWLVFSGHKLGGPFGIGVLYSKEPLPPVVFGGGMVQNVFSNKTEFESWPLGGEAGTAPISGAAGLAAAIQFRNGLPKGWQEHESMLLSLAEKLLDDLPYVNILGKPELREGCLSFTIDTVHPFDVAVLADQIGIALRSGTQCAQPLLRSLNIDYVLRISPAFYNTEEEILQFAKAIENIVSVLKRENMC